MGYGSLHPVCLRRETGNGRAISDVKQSIGCQACWVLLVTVLGLCCELRVRTSTIFTGKFPEDGWASHKPAVGHNGGIHGPVGILVR